MAWTYEPCDRPGRGPSEKARHILDVCRVQDPQGRSLGIFNPRRVVGSRRWSLHACGRAVDYRPSDRAAGDRLAQLLVSDPALDVQLVLWDRSQFGGRRGPRWVPIGSGDPHTDHLHIEVRR